MTSANFPVPQLPEAQEKLLAMSRWVDAGNPELSTEAIALIRLIKLSEESGEVAAAYIGAIGANPRKGVTNGMDKVLDELLDVAVTALGAYEHLQDHSGESLTALLSKIIAVADRAAAFQGESAR